MSLFNTAMQRPSDFNKLSPETQWGIDKNLGILDWDGNCDHQKDGMCPKCRKIWNERFYPEKKEHGKTKTS